MSALNKAISIASDYHSGQFDKAGEAYILHPLRVMMSLETNDEKIVGVLHDVLEDTDFTEADLRRHGFSEEIVEAIKSVTRQSEESYEQFILRARQNAIGRKVKLADLRDNMNWDRIKTPTFEDKKRMQKYQDAYYKLL